MLPFTNVVNYNNGWNRKKLWSIFSVPYIHIYLFVYLFMQSFKQISSWRISFSLINLGVKNYDWCEVTYIYILDGWVNGPANTILENLDRNFLVWHPIWINSCVKLSIKNCVILHITVLKDFNQRRECFNTEDICRCFVRLRNVVFY